MIQDARLRLLLTQTTGQILGAISPADLEWKNMQAEIKSREINCNNIKNRITVEKEDQEKISKILKWISSHDIRGSYQNVLERTGVKTKYSARCQWMLNHSEFEEWSRQGKSSVLWLKGTIGTGKTTVMARAIQEMQNSAMIQIHGMRLAMFFFQKTTGSSTRPLSVEVCLRSLVRQLSWNNRDGEIEPLVETKHNDLENQHAGDSLLSTQECVELLENLISERETYIMIDAIDECEKPHELLELIGHVNTVDERRQALHIMLCARDDLPISEFFENYRTIATNSEDTSADRNFYIDHEIDHICQSRKNSLFVLSEVYPSRLKKILKENCGPMFRWIEIQLEIFRVRYFRTSQEIEQQLAWLQTHTKHSTLSDEYARLLALLKEHPPNEELVPKTLTNDELAFKMLKLIACSEYNLSAENLAEAITASKSFNDVVELTPDDVRRILVGFISETAVYEDQRSVLNLDVPVVQLAHSSVLEYLTDDINDLGFSTLAQHSEAALLCFSRISTLEKRPELSPEAGSSSPGMASMKEVSKFLEYSCIVWPIHCRRAFDEDPKCSLLVRTKDFMLSDGFMEWNETIRSSELNKKYPFVVPHYSALPVTSSTDRSFGKNAKRRESMSCNDLSARPSFVITRYAMTELLEFPEIRVLIDLQHTNSYGMSLLVYALAFGKSSTVDRLIELYPDQVRPSEGQNALQVAALRGFDDVVEKLLNSGDDVNVENPRSALSSAIHGYLFTFQDYTFDLQGSLVVIQSILQGSSFVCDMHSKEREGQAWMNTIQILLSRGANIFEFGSLDGRSIMHIAVESKDPTLPSLFVERAVQLEESGLVGSIQRLLRGRDLWGETLLGFALNLHTEYLQDVLDAAVIRNNGKIMYDFDNPNITQISEGWVQKELLWQYLKRSSPFSVSLRLNSDDEFSEQENLDATSYKEAAEEYRAWLTQRWQELDSEYEINRFRYWDYQSEPNGWRWRDCPEIDELMRTGRVQIGPDLIMERQDPGSLDL